MPDLDLKNDPSEMRIKTEGDHTISFNLLELSSALLDLQGDDKSDAAYRNAMVAGFRKVARPANLVEPLTDHQCFAIAEAGFREWDRLGNSQERSPAQ